ncbi:conserved hypothetical protein [Ricinus communis]|uniref:Uncharacterized protein n=1 Tax=Ricinus communis TaxID=3988 RepID=B9T031_RICCO|nr:conserved hypothetical protein [Ricinus communis]
MGGMYPVWRGAWTGEDRSLASGGSDFDLLSSAARTGRRERKNLLMEYPE